MRRFSRFRFNVFPYKFSISVENFKKIIIFTGIISLAYLSLVILLTDLNLDEVQAAAIRVLVFLFISGVVSILSRRLKDRELRYRNIFENTGSAMVSIDADMRITLVNREMENLVGIPEGELIGMRLTDFIAQDDLQKMSEYYHDRMEDPGTVPPPGTTSRS